MSQNIKKIIETNGYVILKKLFSKQEINNIFNSYEKNLDYCLQLMKSSKKFKSLDKKYLYLKKKNSLLKSKSYDLSKYHPSIFQLATSKRLNKILKNYFNEEFFLDLPQIRIDDNKNSFMLPPHQEIFGQMSKKIITLWAPLTNVSIKNGTMGLVEKSHLKGVRKHSFYKIKSKKYHGVEKKLLRNVKFKYLNLSSGDAVLFHPYLIHTSAKNFSKKVRWTFVARYNGLSGIEYLKKNNSPLRIQQK